MGQCFDGAAVTLTAGFDSGKPTCEWRVTIMTNLIIIIQPSFFELQE